MRSVAWPSTGAEKSLALLRHKTGKYLLAATETLTPHSGLAKMSTKTEEEIATYLLFFFVCEEMVHHDYL